MGHLLDDGSPDDTNIKFVVTYQGTGWFGIGISLDGTMGSNGQGTDMVLCTVQGNKEILAQQTKRCCCCFVVLCINGVLLIVPLSFVVFS